MNVVTDLERARQHLMKCQINLHCARTHSLSVAYSRPWPIEVEEKRFLRALDLVWSEQEIERNQGPQVSAMVYLP